MKEKVASCGKRRSGDIFALNVKVPPLFAVSSITPSSLLSGVFPS
jgi:hypothetical protein